MILEIKLPYLAAYFHEINIIHFLHWEKFTICRPQLCFLWLVKPFNFVAKLLNMHLLNKKCYKANYAVIEFSCYIMWVAEQEIKYILRTCKC